MINKSDGETGDAEVIEWCARKRLPILVRIPHSEAFAGEYTEGRVSQEYMAIAEAVWAGIGRGGDKR